MSQKVWLNNAFVDINDAHISVLDRGFLFGDGVYEVIPVYGGRPFRMHAHLDRLRNSLAAIKVSLEQTDEQWRDILQPLIDQYPNQDQSVYLQVTRGTDDRRDHRIPDNIDATVFCMSTPLKPGLTDKLSLGINAITLDDIRWSRCDIKAITLLGNLLLKQQARDQQADEAILVRDHRALEGAASNLFIVSNGLLITPPKSNLLLPGITRDLILELAAANGIPWSEAAIPVESLNSADEIWLTSSTREIMPVVQLNGKPVGNGLPGPLWQLMSDTYRAYKARFILGEVD